jgi:hypothetical protein
MKRLIALVAFAMLAAVPAFAHHGWGGNETKLTDITGVTTTAVSLNGPHATMKLKDAQGNLWDATLAPPPRTEASGIKATTIPVGSTVTVHGHRNKNQNTYEIKVTKLTFNNRLYDVYPGMD